jgi:hypothetical protein
MFIAYMHWNHHPSPYPTHHGYFHFPDLTAASILQASRECLPTATAALRHLALQYCAVPQCSHTSIPFSTHISKHWSQRLSLTSHQTEGSHPALLLAKSPAAADRLGADVFFPFLLLPWSPAMAGPADARGTGAPRIHGSSCRYCFCGSALAAAAAVATRGWELMY